MCFNFCYRKENCVGRDVYFKPPITIRFHDLHACDIRGDVGEIISYHKKE